MIASYSRHHRFSGFSLVEVTLAIGIVSFALLAVVALLPMGLRTVKNSNEQAAGAAVLETLGEALRHASSTNGTSFRVLFNQTTNFFTAGSSNLPPWNWTNINLEGVEDMPNRRIVARLEILEAPSSDGLRPGRAVASVAWSAAGNPVFEPSTHSWTRAEGSLTAPLQFFPGRP